MPQIQDKIDFPLYLFHETEKAWKVWHTMEPARGQWLPKSQCSKDELLQSTKGKPSMFSFRVPEWLAVEKGLI